MDDDGQGTGIATNTIFSPSVFGNTADDDTSNFISGISGIIDRL